MGAPKSSRSAETAAGAAHAVETAVESFVAARLRSGDRLCVALSGGQDSVVLLHALRRVLARLSPAENRPFALSALHVHHGLSHNADNWAAFCAALCHDSAVPLSVVRVEVPRDSGEGIEAAARRLRHAAFAACAADWLALAHHRDDQAETVLLNLLRGAGVAGAAGMLAERAQPAGPALIRPLLDVPQAGIAAYAVAHRLAWIDDESNRDTHFRRNYLRREIMPRLDEPFPGARQALARAAGHFAEAGLLLDDLAAIDRHACASGSGRIALAGFNALPKRRAHNLLRYELLGAGFRAPQSRWLDEALRQLAATDEVSETRVSTPDGDLLVYRGELYAVRQRPPAPDRPLPWSGQGELAWAGGQVRFVERQGEGLGRRHFERGDVRLTARRGGERLQPDARRPRRTLRNLLQEGGIPPWERERLPCLWCGERLAWVGGVGCDAALACAPGEAGLLPLWVP